MKAIQRTVMKIVPGKMEEYMKLMEKHKAIVGRLGFPSQARAYRLASGEGDVMHTIIYEVD